MQPMTSEMEAILQSRKQIGINRPANFVSIEGMPSGLSSTKITQGIGSTYKLISNWIETDDRRYMCCWFDASSHLLQTGFSNNLSFLNTDFAISSIVEDDSISVAGEKPRQVTLFRRSDNQVLMFVNDTQAAGAAATPLTLKCYKSTTGNGDDWVILSTIESWGSDAYTFISTYAEFVGKPIYIKDESRIILSYNGYEVNGTQLDTIAKSAYSDDEGATWTKVEIYNTHTDYRSVGQLCSLPDDTLFVAVTRVNGANFETPIYKSLDDGATWVTASVDFSNVFTDDALTDCAYHSFYYDSLTDSVWDIFMNAAPRSGGSICQILAPTAARFIVTTNWTELLATSVADSTPGFPYRIGGSLCMQMYSIQGAPTFNEFIIAGESPPFNVKSITVNRSQGMAASCNIVLDNKAGIYSPDSAGDYADVLFPNKAVYVWQGYGEHMIKTFTGLIDSVSMKSFPQEISITARDNMKILIDNYHINAGATARVETFSADPIEDIVEVLALRAGLFLISGGLEATGITITSFVVSWETWMDACSRLADMAAFEMGCDEFGLFYFRKREITDTPTADYEFTEGVDISNISYEINDANLYHTIVVHGMDSTAQFLKGQRRGRVLVLMD